MDVFVEISLIIVFAAVVSGVMRLLKQPLIIGYIVTGLAVGPYGFFILKSTESLEVFSQFGIAMLLFIVGLNLSPKVIREVGKVALITGLGQVLFTSVVGYGISRLLGFGNLPSIYISVALTFSSTIIILKLLSDKGDLDSLYGKISIGFLLVQDIVATLILIVVSSTTLGSNPQEIAINLILRGILLVALISLFVKFILPKLSKFFARSQEFLFLFSIAWGLGLASLFHYLGFSIEIGALVAGVALSLFPYNYEISAKMRPLRDFFIILFFILLGSQLNIDNPTKLIAPALILSAFVLIGNPLIVMILMGSLKYSKKIGFMSGLTVAQISEFSLILVALGYKLGHVSGEVVSLITIVGLITIAGSSYMIIFSDKVYPFISRYLSVFERNTKIKGLPRKINYDAILFGYNRIGYDFLGVFRKIGAKYLVVDYDPDVVSNLNEAQIPCEYGDVGDVEFLDELNLESIKMAVSTIPEYEINIILIDKIRKQNAGAIIMVISHNIDDTYKLYERGATYVVMPHFLGGTYASALVHKHKFNTQKFAIEKDLHIKHLNKRKVLGHEHPEILKNG